jgi:uncharacterized Zn finger protein (UPF0148 family)
MKCSICGCHRVRATQGIALYCPACTRRSQKLASENDALVSAWEREDALRAENAFLRDRCATLERVLGSNISYPLS